MGHYMDLRRILIIAMVSAAASTANASEVLTMGKVQDWSVGDRLVYSGAVYGFEIHEIVGETPDAFWLCIDELAYGPGDVCVPSQKLLVRKTDGAVMKWIYYSQIEENGPFDLTSNLLARGT